MSLPPTTVYLEKRVYRLRRLTDAAQLLPIFGVLLFLVPLLWASAATTRGVIYIFAIWAALIAVSAVFSYFLARVGTDSAGQDRPE